MNLTKLALQAAVVLMWAIYVAGQILANAGGDGRVDPTAGTGLLGGYLATLPVEALVVPTAVLAAVFLAIEVVFVALRRVGGP